MVEPPPRNLKATVPADVDLAGAYAGRRQMVRTGIGYDAHRLALGRLLRVGGVEIPWPRGLAGHSDADVLAHAIMDALLGAAGLGDLGRHFPPGDPAFRGADSIELLRRVTAMAVGAGWRVVHVDSTVLAEAPRLAPYIPQMQERLPAPPRRRPSARKIQGHTTEGVGAIRPGGRDAGDAGAALHQSR